MNNDLKPIQREIWIDNLKGLGILFVMWGHVQIVTTSIGQWITMFHIQIFLILSGYLYFNNELTEEKIKSKIWKTAYTYFIFSCLAILINAIYNFLTNANVIKYIILDVYKTCTLYGIFALWYLPSYVIATLLFFVINKHIKNNAIKYSVNVLGLISSVAISFALKKFAGGGTTAYAIISFPAIALFRSIACAAYISVGYAIGKNKFLCISNTKKILIGILMLASAFVVALDNENKNFSTLTYGSKPILYIIGSFLGAIGIMLLLSCFKKKIPIVNWCGKNSLLLLITHMTFRLTNISQWVVKRSINEENVLFGALCLVLMLLAEIPIVWLLNGKLSFLVKSNKFQIKNC